jgi:hypothetical protein
MWLAVVHGYKERNVGLLYSFISRLEWFEHTNLKPPRMLLMRIKERTQIFDMKERPKRVPQ